MKSEASMCVFVCIYLWMCMRVKCPAAIDLSLLEMTLPLSLIIYTDNNIEKVLMWHQAIY